MVPNLHDFVVERLLGARGRWPAIADESGVPLRTIEKIARKETEDPRYSNVQKLYDYFVAQDAPDAAARGGHAAQ